MGQGLLQGPCSIFQTMHGASICLSVGAVTQPCIALAGLLLCHGVGPMARTLLRLKKTPCIALVGACSHGTSWLAFPCMCWCVCVCAAFEGEMEDELTIAKGEAFIVHSEVDGWLEVTRLSDNRSGMVPVGYIQ